VSRLSKFSTEANTRGRGRVGESAALTYLRRRGYRIVETNYTVRPGEIDVIALDAEILCFVEVKARATPSFGTAVAAVTLSKQRRLTRVAAAYLAKADWQGPCRFDVLGIDREANEEWAFTLVKDAFGVDGEGA
jgi:putative endonuclease